MKALIFVLRLFVVAALVFGVLGISSSAKASTSVAQNKPDNKDLSTRIVNLSTDNVSIALQTPYLPNDTFTVAEPGMSVQGAMSEGRDVFSFFAVIAVPFGTRPPSESVPVARSGAAEEYRTSLRAGLASSEVEYQPNGPVSILFGQSITGQVSLHQLAFTTKDGSTRPFLYAEWVVEAGPRLWIIRIVKQLPDHTTDLSSQAAFLKSLENVTLSSNNLDSPTTVIPTNPPGTPTAVVTPKLPGMPITGEASSGVYGLSTFLILLLGSLVLLSGFCLRRMHGLNKKV